MRTFHKPDPADRLLLTQCRLNRRFFLALASAAGLSLVAPGVFSWAAILDAPAVPPIDAAAPDVTRTATFAMG